MRSYRFLESKIFDEFLNRTSALFSSLLFNKILFYYSTYWFNRRHFFIDESEFAFFHTMTTDLQFSTKVEIHSKNRDTKTKLLGITGSITLLFFCNITHWNSIEDFNFKVEMCFFFETSKPICLLISQMVVCERKWTKLTRKFVNDRRTDGQNLLGGERGRRQRGCAERGVMIQANVPSSQPANAASAWMCV